MVTGVIFHVKNIMMLPGVYFPGWRHSWKFIQTQLVVTGINLETHDLRQRGVNKALFLLKSLQQATGFFKQISAPSSGLIINSSNFGQSLQRSIPELQFFGHLQIWWEWSNLARNPGEEPAWRRSFYQDRRCLSWHHVSNHCCLKLFAPMIHGYVGLGWFGLGLNNLK